MLLNSNITNIQGLTCDSWNQLSNVYSACLSSSAKDVKEQFQALPADCRHRIYGLIYRQNLQHFSFDDLSRLIEAIHTMAFEALNCLSKEQPRIVMTPYYNFLEKKFSKGNGYDKSHKAAILFKGFINYLNVRIIINDWISAQPEEKEKRKKISTDIMEFIFDEKKDSLTLDWEHGVSSLPNIFNSSCFNERVKYLSLDGISALPDSFFQLGALEDLMFTGYCRDALPAQIGNLTTLKSLSLPVPGFISVPAELFNLTALTRLNLWVASETLPNEIGNLQELEDLNLYSGDWNSLPCTIGNLSKLKKLDLSYCSDLTGLPIEIFNLPSSCTIDINRTGISTQVLERIRETTSAEGYNGPRFSYSMPGERITVERSTEELLIELYALISQEPPSLEHLKQDEDLANDLQLWLSRLSWTCDYKNGGEARAGFAKKIIGYLELANKHPGFCGQFKIIISGACETCGDRVALSILHLGIAYKLTTFDRSNMPGLAEFLTKGVWVMNMLEEIARKKVAILPFFDEVEVYLGYPVKLKERLGLPIDVSDMLFFACSALKDDDLDDAENYVKAMLNNQAAYFGFLISNDFWIEALSKIFPEVKALLDERYTLLLNGDEEGVQKVNNNLIKLSKHVL